MKIVSCVPVVSMGRVLENANSIIQIMEKYDGDIFLFPAYCLTGASVGELCEFKEFREKIEEGLDFLCNYSKKSKKVFVSSVPYYENIVIRNGEILEKNVFDFDGKAVAVSENGDEKCDILLLPTAMPGYPCIQNDIIEFAAAASAKNSCVVAVANCGFGESSADNVYKGFCGVFKNGITVAFMAQDAPETVVALSDYENEGGLIYTRKNVADYKVPYYGKNDKIRYLTELFALQTQALYMRIMGCGLKKAVVNVSGGLDSTLALLVAENAFKMAGLPTENIIGLTLPCFGTSKRTNENAKNLMKTLGITQREININKTVLQHFYDIGHSPEKTDATYENAQARYRAMVLFSVCNSENALAIGTGDMSEAALGFCTYAGDTLSHYNVNASVPKTIIRHLIALLSEKRGGKLGIVLADIVATPISPELLTNQETEKILGDYILLDFIMFYYGKFKMRREEIFQYMQATFDEYDDETLNTALNTFFSRYHKNQFKRSSACEGANLIGFTLPYFPADMSFSE